MQRIIKWLAIALLGLAVAMLIAIVVIQQYKTEILASINQRLKESVNGDVNIGDYHITVFHNFPNISITLKEIYLHGPAFEVYHRAFLKAERIDVNVEPLKLFSKTISIKSVDIENGEIFVFRTASGYTNLNVFKANKEADSVAREKNALVDLKEIRLTNVMITYEDSLKKKNFGVHLIHTENSISSKDSSILFHIGGDMKFSGLMLNALKGSYLKNKNVQADLNLELDPVSHHLLISPSLLIFEKSTLHLSGMFQLTTPGSFQLDIQSDNLDFNEGLTIMPDTLAKRIGKYQIEKPVKLTVNLRGVLEPGAKPAVDVMFAFENSKVTAGKIRMDSMSMNGVFINHVNNDLIYDDRNSQIDFTAIRGLVDNLPVDAVATLTDFTDPALKLKAVFDVDLRRLNDYLDTVKIKMIGGHFLSNFTYSGKLREYLDDSKVRYDGQLSGKAEISKGQVKYFRKKVSVDNINGTFIFTEKKFEIKDLSLALNKNRLALTGFITDFVPFFTTPETTGKVNLSITSPRIDVSGLLLPRKIVKTKTAKAASKKKMADTMEKLNEELEFDLVFRVNEFVNNNFKASNVKGRLILANNRFLVKNAMMDFANGKVEMNLNIFNLQRAINPFNLDAKLRDVEIKNFLYAFNNFNQTTFRHDHVDGKLSLDVNLKAEINDKLEVLTPRLQGVASFKIQNARLRDFEPMQRLSNFLFKGRDFSDVQFGEINSQVEMTGTMMTISRMEIESTVMTMFIEGKYDLQDSSDLSIQVPLSNLKKRDQDFAPENVGVDTKAGPSVFLRVRPDKNGKTAIAYDPFKKFRKKKKNSKAT